MKKLTLLLTLVTLGLSVSIVSNAQQQQRDLTWGGETRQYLEYVPAIYNSSTPAPVVFALHGLGDNMNNFSNIRLRNVADTAGCIVITPQALVAYYMSFEIGTAWNCGASLYNIVPNAHVDDMGFLFAILDSLENHFNIDVNRVYFVGFSMGAYMCNRVAVEHASRVRAIASVSGTLGNSLSPVPTGNISVLHIHGTADTQVEYQSNGSGMDAEELVNFWISYNNCDTVPEIYEYPDLVQDGLEFVRYNYTNGNNNANVSFIKVLGGEHNWYFTPNNDIDYTTEIWKFLIAQPVVANVADIQKNNNPLSLFPNPASEHFRLNLLADDFSQGAHLSILDLSGRVVLSRIVASPSEKIAINKLTPGVYLVRLNTAKTTYEQKLVIVK